MDRFERKTLVTRRALKYTYYVSPAGVVSEAHPPLLFLHGFPDSAHLWTDVIGHLRDLPNKIIVPDCLGYAGTDKPADPALYAAPGQAADLVDLLRAEVPDGHKTVVVGHDWGSYLAQRLYLYHRERIGGVALVNTGYLVPSDDAVDVDAINAYTEQAVGVPQLAYWDLFTAPDGADVVDRHLDRMWLALHGDRPDWMKQLFCVRGAMRAFLLGDEAVALRPYAAARRVRDRFMHQFSQDNGGFAPALQMYKTTANNTQRDAHAAVAPPVDLAFQVPVLYVICTGDAVCMPELMMAPAKAAGLVPHLREAVLDCAHWSPMERPAELAAAIQAFLDRDIKQ